MEVVGSVRRGLLLILLCYLLSRIIIAYRKMREGQIGTLFHRINSPTVQVDRDSLSFSKEVLIQKDTVHKSTFEKFLKDKLKTTIVSNDYFVHISHPK